MPEQGNPEEEPGEVKFKTPVTDQTPYRSKYTDYRHQSSPTDDWDDSPTKSYDELDSAFRDEGDLFSKEGGDADGPCETPRSSHRVKQESKPVTHTYEIETQVIVTLTLGPDGINLMSAVGGLLFRTWRTPTNPP